MNEEAWSELDIAPTGDPAAVRRAYARRLRVIDADRDLAAFMRLREAYVGALAEAERIAAGDGGEDRDDAWGEDGASGSGDAALDRDGGDDAGGASTPERSNDPPDDADLSVSGQRLPAGLIPALPPDAFVRFRDACGSAIRNGDTRSAAALLKSALAAGIVPIGQEQELSRQLAECALGDATLSPEEVEAIRRTFGMAMPRIGDRPAAALQDLMMRPDAQRWKAGILRDARRGDHWIMGYLSILLRKRVRVARAIRDPLDQNLISRDLPAFRREVFNARRYERLLAEPFDPLPLEEKLKRLEKTLLGHEVLAVFIVIVVTPLFGVVYGWPLAAALGGLFVVWIACLFLAG